MDANEAVSLVWANFEQEHNPAKAKLAFLRLINEAYRQGYKHGEEYATRPEFKDEQIRSL